MMWVAGFRYSHRWDLIPLAICGVDIRQLVEGCQGNEHTV